MSEDVVLIKYRSKLLYFLADYAAVIAVWIIVNYIRWRVLNNETGLFSYITHLRLQQLITVFIVVPAFTV
jgi:hypothetical protein